MEMTRKQSAGILLYRFVGRNLQIFLVYPWSPPSSEWLPEAWSIPKGEFSKKENPAEAAKREFREEVGHEIIGEMIELTPVKQKGGKLVFAWAVQGDLDPRTIHSNKFEIEWPPESGIKQHVPEIVKGEWFDVKTAKEKINAAQASFIDELLEKLKFDDGEGSQDTKGKGNKQR